MTGLLRVNLKGREPNGLVAPGDEYEKLCGRLIDALTELENVDTGDKAVQWVAHSRDLYQGSRLDELPDLFVEWNHRAPITNVASPRIGTVQGNASSRRTGSHRPGAMAE